jgi:putative ABC transport system ATP-binding protein
MIDEVTARENVDLPALLAGRSPRVAPRPATELLDRAAFLTVVTARRGD